MALTKEKRERLKKAVAKRRKDRKDNEVQPNRIKRLKKVLKTKLA